MKKIVLSAILVLSMFAPLLLILSSTSVTACDAKMPETLLSLYRNSDAIHIGRYLGSEEGEVTHDDDEYTTVEIKKLFDISSTLKGQPIKSFTQLDSDYRYKGRKAGFETIGGVQEEQVAPEIDVEDVSRDLKAGDNVLLFLRKDEDSNQFVLTDYSDAVKNLPMSDIAVYEARINELNSIFATAKPDTEKIVEWLVRCAEDAATRWEGTYELERSFEALEYKTKRDAERKETEARGEDIEEEDYYTDDSLDTGRTTAFARLLNSYQKQSLANILLNGEFQAASQKAGKIEVVRGDSELIRLISRWADERIAELFLGRLRGGTYLPDQISELMNTIASILDDKQINLIAEKYSNIYYKRDDVEVGKDDLDEPEENTADSETVIKPESGKSIVLTEAPIADTTESKTDDTAGDETAKKTAMTYKELRENLTNKFLIRVDEVLANPEVAITRSSKKEER